MPIKDSRGNLITSPFAGAIKYEYDWFSGSQISVMIGDVVVDAGVAVQFSVQQSKSPVYGYANQYYTFVSDGKVLVTGSLTIAFKEAGYLLWPIQRFANQVNAGQWTSPRFGTDKNGNLIRGFDVGSSDGRFTTAAKAAEDRRLMEANVEQMVEWSTRSGSGGLQNGTAYNNFYRDLGALPDDKFEDYAEVFEDAIWYGSDTANAGMRDQLFSKNIQDRIMGYSAGQIDEEAVLSHRRADQYPAVDIWIVYGDMSRPAVNHTVKKLLDVSFVGQAQTIEVSGEPTYETYNFFCRNLV